MNTKTIWVFARTASMLIGVVLFVLGLLKEDLQIFWLGTVLFMVGFGALAYVTRAEFLLNESDSGHE